MRHRRGFGRSGLLRPLRRAVRLLGVGARHRLRQANRLADDGDYAAAAPLLEELAFEARRLDLTDRAPFLMTRAGRAWLRAGNITRGLELARSGLQDLALSGRQPAAADLGRMVVLDLHELNRPAEASELSRWLAGIGVQPAVEPGGDAAAQPLPATPAPRLPEKCPYCGATLSPGEVEWVDEATAECAYCGSAVQTR